MKKYVVKKEKVDGYYRAVLYLSDKSQGHEHLIFIRDLDLHNQLPFKQAKETLLKHAPPISI